MFKAEVVGSLLRPDYLMRARQQLAAGEISPAEFRAVEDRAVGDAVSLQEAAGLDVVTDGEQRRQFFASGLTHGVEGLAEIPGREVRWHGRGAAGPYTVSIVTHLVVTRKLRHRRSVVRDEFLAVQAVAKAPVKVTLPSPLTMAFFWSPTVSSSAYADPFDLFADAAGILREEIETLCRLGCTNIQIDAPEIGMLVDPAVRRHFSGVGISPARMLDDGIASIEALARGVEGVRFALHLCRGNNAGHWMGCGGYQSIAKQVFPCLRSFRAFLLEFDDARSGSFEPLRYVPDDTQVVLGLVSTKTGEIEDTDALIARVDEASRYVPRERLGVSTQCGFASVADGNPVGPDDQARKLHVVVEVARRALG